MKDDRRKRIEALVSQRDTVTMEELRDAFGVSMNTVRSDVAYLVGAGAVEKIYGGVRAVQRQEAPLFTQRTQLRTEEKRRVARRAQELIEDGDTLYIDAGTTTMHLIDFLDPAKHVTIVTGNLYVVRQARRSSGCWAASTTAPAAATAGPGSPPPARILPQAAPPPGSRGKRAGAAPR